MKFETGEEGTPESQPREPLSGKICATLAEDVPLLAVKPQWRHIKDMRQGVLAAFVVREPLAYLRDLNL